MQRFFIPAVACPSCAYANDHLFRFCQMCGYQRKSVPRQPASKIAVDLAAIDARLQQLTQTAKRSSYSKQKSSLRVEFETFLASLLSVRSIHCPKRLPKRLKLSIPILGNFAPSSTKPVALTTGIACWVLVILLLLFQSKVTLRLCLRSNCVHISSLSGRSRFFYLSFCSWRGYMG